MVYIKVLSASIVPGLELTGMAYPPSFAIATINAAVKLSFATIATGTAIQLLLTMPSLIIEMELTLPGWLEFKMWAGPLETTLVSIDRPRGRELLIPLPAELIGPPIITGTDAPLITLEMAI